MSVKIRLQRKGRKKKPVYHIVAADSRAPRDGKFIEKLGIYNPLTVPATIELNRDAAYQWLQKGAQPTDTARAILKFKGVYYYKHLQRGVAKGAFDQAKADEMFNEWIAGKEAIVENRKQKTAAEKEARRLKIFGEIPPKPTKTEEAVEEAVAETTEEAVAETTEEAVAETTEEAVAETTEEAAVETTEEAAVETTEEAAAETTEEE